MATPPASRFGAIIRVHLPTTIADEIVYSPHWIDFIRELGRLVDGDVATYLHQALPLATPSEQVEPAAAADLIRTRVLDLARLDHSPEHPEPEPPSPDHAPPVIEADDSVAPALEVPRERLLQLVEAATSFYQAQLPGTGAQSYLHHRLGRVDVEGFRIGYAPAGWDTLTQVLRVDQGATDVELVAAGLSRWSRRGTLIDQFRDRLVLAIHNLDGHVVGFTGRAAPGADPTIPKYINTPETDLFHKSRLLFGLHEGVSFASLR